MWCALGDLVVGAIQASVTVTVTVTCTHCLTTVQIFIKQDSLPVKGRLPANGIHKHVFCSCGLDLHLDLHLDTRAWPRYSEDVLAYQNELSSSMLSKVKALETDRQTDRHTEKCDWKQYHAALAGGKTSLNSKVNLSRFVANTSCQSQIAR